MAISNFISTVWSENLYKELDKQYIAVSNCNRDYEGEIKNMGSSVKICGIGKINIGDYTKNTDMFTPQALSDTVRELVIDQAKYFNFQIDDIDKTQSSPKLMDAAMSMAASAPADEADKYVYSLHDDCSGVFPVNEATEECLLNSIIEAKQRLYEENVSDASDIILEVSPAVASLILKTKIAIAKDNNEALENGCIGSICGCKVFVSNNIANVDGYHKCFMRTKRAIAFAEQLSEIVAYHPEKRFADAIKGLHLYGAKVIYPKEFVVLDVDTSAMYA